MRGCVRRTVPAKVIVKARPHVAGPATARVRLRLRTDPAVRIPATTCAVPAARNVVVRNPRVTNVAIGETGPWMALAE